MQAAFAQFLTGVASSTELAALYQYLQAQLVGPFVFDDLLRFQIVFAISSFDAFNHAIIRIGMLQSFIGTRPATQKFLSETVQISTYQSMRDATINQLNRPREHFFEQEIIRKHRLLSFQEPTRIAEGLSLIWGEQHKWAAIARQMGQQDRVVRETLSAMITKRNRIVHEADIDPVTGAKTPITQPEAENVSNFIRDCGTAIYALVQ